MGSFVLTVDADAAGVVGGGLGMKLGCGVRFGEGWGRVEGWGWWWEGMVH